MDIANTIIKWQLQHGRKDLPWQQNITPYKVLISEIMLQQTQVKTVIPYFQKWLKYFPTIDALAIAEEDKVLKLWEGLGYYSRARNLIKASKFILDEFGGKIPDDREKLLSIPGVGPYTSGAILSFAFNKYGPIVDGNVNRLFSRFFGIDECKNSSLFQRKIWQLSIQHTPQTSNRIYTQGLIDLGALICTPRNFQCDLCPLQLNCYAFKTRKQLELPLNTKKKKKIKKDKYFIWCKQNDHILLEKRNEKDVWFGLWCLPEINEGDLKNINYKLKGKISHKFTHYELSGHVIEVSNLKVKSTENSKYFQSTSSIALPTPIKKFIKTNLD